MSDRCAAGYRLHGSEPCAECGARPNETCGQYVRMTEAQVAKLQADNADQATTIATLKAALEPFEKLAKATYGGVGLTRDCYVTHQIKIADLDAVSAALGNSTEGK